jgi:hypothetical protein
MAGVAETWLLRRNSIMSEERNILSALYGAPPVLDICLLMAMA